MNPDNVGTLLACQRLQAAGIVLETDFQYDGLGCLQKGLCSPFYFVPAPSMAEVWRELPEQAQILKSVKTNVCWTEIRPTNCQPFAGANPTDCLIDLLIWVEQRKEKA